MEPLALMKILLPTEQEVPDLISGSALGFFSSGDYSVVGYVWDRFSLPLSLLFPLLFSVEVSIFCW